MKHTVNHLNGATPIETETVVLDSVNVIITDNNGIKYGLQLKVEDLNIDDKILTALNEQYGV